MRSDLLEDHRRRLRRRLLQVALSDASSCGVLIAVALGTRRRPSGPTYAAIARVAVVSLLPGAAAVLRERRAHRVRARPHGMGRSVLLVAAGSVIVSVGTVHVMTSIVPAHAPSRPATVVDLALLASGNAIGLPYLLLIDRLHRAADGRGRRRSGDLRVGVAMVLR